MGVGLAVFLDRSVPGADPSTFEGRVLNRARWELSDAAETAGLKPLDEFVSLSPEESEILAADLNFDSEVDAATPAGWFEAQTGLDLARSLRASVTADPEAYPSPDDLLAELTAFETLLVAATRHGARFRLSVAY